MSDMMMQGQGMMQPPPAQGGQGGDDFETALEDLLAQARDLAQVANDPEEALTVEKITTMIQQMLTGRHKADQDMLAGKANPAALVRALSGGA